MALIKNSNMMIISIFIGLALVGVSVTLSYHTLGCPDKDMQVGIQMLIAMSSIVLTVSGSYFFCVGSDGESGDASIRSYMIMNALLGTGIITAGSLIINAIDKNTTGCSKPLVKKLAYAVLSIGIILTLISIIYSVVSILAAGKKNNLVAAPRL
jgi:hypothetical protein